MANPAEPTVLLVLDSGITVTLYRNLTRRTIALTKNGAEVRVDEDDFLDIVRTLAAFLPGGVVPRRRVDVSALSKTCGRGHVLTPRNTLTVVGGRRDCRRCARLRSARYAAKKNLSAAAARGTRVEKGARDSPAPVPPPLPPVVT